MCCALIVQTTQCIAYEGEGNKPLTHHLPQYTYKEEAGISGGEEGR